MKPAGRDGRRAQPRQQVGREGVAALVVPRLCAEVDGARVVNALVPLSEMFAYVGDLRSRTQGRASYSMQFDSYAQVPQAVATEIIAKARGE